MLYLLLVATVLLGKISPTTFYAILLPTILFSLSLSSSNLFHCSLSMPQPSLYIHPSTNTLRIFLVKEYERRG
ncbi:hypothetical protein F5882DRAFT_418552 [Hyaloscypha sp. PMI_1271]|nr:hypothetical protein F5882DRAFT_418552 [Hyaloscypha sp. PMI_1271]